MAQNSGMVQRGLLLLGLMLILVTVVGLVLFRAADTAPQVKAAIAERQPSKPGWLVRYNATTTLARRGTKELPCDVIAEMLDEDQQLRNFMTKTPDGKDTTDEQAARKTVLITVKALDEWLTHKEALPALTAKNAAGWQRVLAALDKLTHSDNPILRQEAEALKQKIAAGG